ncbi:MAG TPA: GAF domain-containing protein, partial [Candidatus Limnocylindrales bacterium]|nr:GAF domain-containing protein [Candidatus Limnocylindrales bacterium]
MTETAQKRRSAGDDLRHIREEQAAVADVLRTMSQSPSDLDAIIDAILAAATRLCHAAQGYIYVLDGDVYRITRTVGIDKAFDEWARANPVPVGDTGKATSRAALLGRPLHIPDVLEDPTYTFSDAQRRGNFRAILCVPLMKDGVAVAVISMWRTVPEPFTDDEITLVATFADQALIAFENVRLAEETRHSLEQETASAEILRVISESPTDVGPVLETIARNAVRYCGAEDAIVLLRESDAMYARAHAGPISGAAGMDRPMPIDAETVGGRSMIDRRTVHVDDLQTAP